MKIVIADSLPDSAAAVLRAEGWTVDSRAGRPREELVADLAEADGLIVRSATTVDRELLAAAPRLRVVARAGTGVDNVDLATASERGVIVVNAPGANSISVAELACALILSLSRSIATADAQMKAGRWEKKSLQGAEVRGKTLGIVGFGRIGREVARRAQAFEMEVVAHDPFITGHVADDLDIELLELDDLCARADVISLHIPATAATNHLFDEERIARCKRGVRIVNTARGGLLDEAALAAAITSGHVAGAALDVFETEPPGDTSLVGLPQVIATPHIAASTREAQELVGVETATCVRDFLRAGVVRNAVNFPSVSPEEFRRLQPYVTLGERLGRLLGQINDDRLEAVGIRYYGDLASQTHEMLAGAVLVGLFQPLLSTPVTLVNARAVAQQRGIEVIESQSTRARHFTSLISVKLHTDHGERWVEGAVFTSGEPRLVGLDGVKIEAALTGTLVVIENDDQPGVIGDVGTILGQHKVNIATFALGRGTHGAIGVVSVEANQTAASLPEAALAELRKIPAVRSARRIHLSE